MLISLAVALQGQVIVPKLNLITGFATVGSKNCSQTFVIIPPSLWRNFGQQNSSTVRGNNFKIVLLKIVVLCMNSLFEVMSKHLGRIWVRIFVIGNHSEVDFAGVVQIIFLPHNPSSLSLGHILMTGCPSGFLVESKSYRSITYSQLYRSWSSRAGPDHHITINRLRNNQGDKYFFKPLHVQICLLHNGSIAYLLRKDKMACI